MKKIISNEFKQPLEDLFDLFEETPIASASIGQVHRARLKNNEIVKIKYVTKEEFTKNLDDARKIIIRKLKNWNHEYEYRFLTKLKHNNHYIGKISKIYFGRPYGDLVNTTNVIDNSNSLQNYYSYKQNSKEYR